MNIDWCYICQIVFLTFHQLFNHLQIRKYGMNYFGHSTRNFGDFYDDFRLEQALWTIEDICWKKNLRKAHILFVKLYIPLAHVFSFWQFEINVLTKILSSRLKSSSIIRHRHDCLVNPESVGLCSGLLDLDWILKVGKWWLIIAMDNRMTSVPGHRIGLD